MPRSAWASAARVVDAVADHGHHPTLGLQPLHHVQLPGREDLGHHLVDADGRGDRPRRRLVVAGEQDRVEAQAGAASTTPCRLVAFGSSATTKSARTAPSQAPATTVLPDCLLGFAGTPGRAPPAGGARVAASDRRPPGHDQHGRSTVALHAERRRWLANERDRRQRLALADGLGAGRRRRWPGRSGAPTAASTAPTRRSASARSTPGAGTTSISAMRPVVTVPVLSSTTVSTARVDSRISGPLIRMPSCAPRPVPTRSAVGVARPSAQGQAMMRTATAAVKAAAGSPSMTSQPISVASESRITTGTNTADDAIGQALDRGLARSVRPRPGGPSEPAGCRPRPSWPPRSAAHRR